MTHTPAHRPSPMIGRAVVALCVLAATALSAVPASGSPTAVVPATFEVGGSVRQIWVTGAEAEAPISVVDAGGDTVAEGTTDIGGAFIFRDLEPGGGYQVRQPVGDDVSTSPPLEVLTTDPTPPDPSIYDQTLEIDPETNTGYNYLTTRDGIELAATVRLPGPPDEGPYPTVVEYSGYAAANPEAQQGGTQLAGLFGYATVSVNMRGTGCSGGAFDYFERLQSLDGYDVIETVANQPWVANDQVGMVGISYPAISQLFVASTQPPSLAAISPLSVIDSTATTLYPGGILNSGFALSWGTDRVHDSRPAGPGPDAGQPWAWDRIQAGDTTCADNQDLHRQAVDLLQKIEDNQFYVPEVADPLAPSTFVDQIEAPTYLACQWQDEQTGGHCADMIGNFTGTDQAWFTLNNGSHTDSLAPATFTRWFDFLELYVAKRKPDPATAAFIRQIAPIIYEQSLGVSGVELPPDPFQTDQAGQTYADVKAAFEDLPRVRVLFENGAGGEPGKPVPTAEAGFETFPPANVSAQAWYLDSSGELSAEVPGTPGADSWRYDPSARPRTNFDGGTSGVWVADPDYNWTNLVDGKAVAYQSPPLAQNKVMLGSGSVDLWLRSTAPDVDLQVTLTEVYPDGQERYIQNGWLRASKRALDTGASSALKPVHTFRESDAAPLPEGEWAKARVQLYRFGHVFHAGSRIRISVEAPGGDQPFWAFDTLEPEGDQRVQIARGPATPSRVVLPSVPDLSVDTDAPPCPSLRRQPCRDAAEWTNVSVAAPQAPTGVSAEPGNGLAVVSWNPPDNDGGSPLRGYVVTPRRDGETVGRGVLVGPDQTETTVYGLENGADYTFTVRAANEVGQSAESDASAPVTPTPDPVIADQVDTAYDKLLGRSPSASESSSWIAFLSEGGDLESMTLFLAIAPEGRRNLVSYYYGPYLGRPGDTGGIDYWTDRLVSDLDVASFQAMVLASAEAYTGAGGTDRAWVASLYEHPLLLDRAPDQAGLDFWIDYLDAHSRRDVARRFVTSAEAARHSASEAYQRLTGSSASAAERAEGARWYAAAGHDLWRLQARLLGRRLLVP